MTKIQDYWIPELREIVEFKEIANTENVELENLWTRTDDVLNNQFILTTTKEGISRYEKMLGIVPFADDTLESRRFRVLARYNEQLPYTYRTLISRLNLLCGPNGYALTLKPNEYSLKVLIELTNKRMFDEIQILLKQIVPANLTIEVALRYNQHKQLKKFTHGELKQFTQLQLREEVLP